MSNFWSIILLENTFQCNMEVISLLLFFAVLFCVGVGDLRGCALRRINESMVLRSSHVNCAGFKYKYIKLVQCTVSENYKI